MNSNERFEYMAELFYKETGYMAPGKDLPAAFKNEKRLHKVCSKHKINREWFDLDCMGLVVNFKPKTK